ncbi:MULTISPECIES: hypothetical protein [Candidatus Cardinium]|uniref:hypothetical protein n=1 Tax=Candidatus Cardinium TaxID=273135 RepID=UPI001FAA6F4F|nr:MULTISPECIES: hypothetical protein [Cardinium]
MHKTKTIHKHFIFSKAILPALGVVLLTTQTACSQLSNTFRGACPSKLNKNKIVYTLKESDLNSGAGVMAKKSTNRTTDHHVNVKPTKQYHNCDTVPEVKSNNLDNCADATKKDATKKIDKLAEYLKSL